MPEKSIFVKSILFLLTAYAFSDLAICQTSDGLIAYYKFDGNTQDDSGNGLNAVVGNNIDFGIFENALVIKDEVNSFVELPFDLLNGIGDFTISAFVKINGLNSNNNFISGANVFTDNAIVIGYNSITTDNFQDGWNLIFGTNKHFFQIDTTINDGDFHHVVISRDGNFARLFIDCEKVGSDIIVNGEPLMIAENGLFIGQDQDCIGGCFQPGQNWNGGIDELRFYNKALSFGEIRELCQLSLIDNYNSKNNFKLFPNPFYSTITIEHYSDKNLKYEVVDVLGEIVDSGVIFGNTIHVNSALRAASYLLLIKNEDSTIIQVFKIFKI